MTNEEQSKMRLIVVTGLSGSGKSIAIRQLEDSGYYCLDNLPVAFLPGVVEHLATHGHNRVAVSVDVRSRHSLGCAVEVFTKLQNEGHDLRVLFLTASTDDLVQRFSETRRRHPLTVPNSENEPELTLSEAIAKERDLLSPVALMSHVMDTSRLPANTLRDWVRQFSQSERSMMTLAFESFAFKHGIPVAADLVFDVRNLPNPFYDKELRPFTGRDEPIIKFLDNCPDAVEMVDDIERFLRKWLPSYEKQNRHYLTIAIGCTGGQHRSVYVSEQLAKRFAGQPGSVIRHRQLSIKKSY